MQSILADGLIVFILYKLEILLFLITAFSLGRLFTNYIFIFQWDETIKPMFAICIGAIVLCGITFILALLSHFIPALFKIGSFFILIFSFLVLIRDVVINRLNLAKLLSCTAILIALFIFQLPILNHIILPGYSDSPVHYQIINQILNPRQQIDANLSIANILVTYYHFGFHSVTAWLSAITGIAITESMSLIGQISLGLSPMSVGSFVFIITKNRLAALSAGLLSIFGWLMPAFAINWGKFPALLSLTLISSVIGYAILSVDSKGNRLRTLLLMSFLIFSISIIHTRILIVLLIILGSIYLTKLFTYIEQVDYLFSLRSSILLILLLLPLKEYIINYYDRFPLSVIIVCLLPFAFFFYPRQITGMFFCLTGIWTLQFLFSVLNISFELLDTQFISIMLFIPFSILGGLSLGGIVKRFTLIPKPLIVIVFMFIVGYHSPWYSSSFPDPCCDYYRKDNESTFVWIMDNTSQDSLFIISTFSDGKQQYSSDAGVWINPLTGRNTNKIQYDINWNEDKIFSTGCNPNQKEVYIYTGGREYSFSNTDLENLQWVESVHTTGLINIYKFVKCK